MKDDQCAGFLVILCVTIFSGAWLYVDSTRGELEMKIAALSSQIEDLQAEFTAKAVPSSDEAPLVLQPIFDPLKIDIGDIVGDMKVTAIQRDADGKPTSVSFIGQATISGTYRVIGEDEEVYQLGSVIFRTDQDALYALPGAPGLAYVDPLGREFRVFSFSNPEEAKKALGASAGSATVLINNYVVRLVEGEVTDAATLVRVLQ